MPRHTHLNRAYIVSNGLSNSGPLVATAGPAGPVRSRQHYIGRLQIHIPHQRLTSKSSTSTSSCAYCVLECVCVCTRVRAIDTVRSQCKYIQLRSIEHRWACAHPHKMPLSRALRAPRAITPRAFAADRAAARHTVRHTRAQIRSNEHTYD